MARRKKNNLLVPFLIGSIIGGAAALAFTPASGKETMTSVSNSINRILYRANEQKHTIIRNAQRSARDIIQKAENVYNLTSNYVSGRYSDSVEMIDLEIKSWRNAVNTAVDTYKNYGTDQRRLRSEVVVNEMFTDFEDETLPKKEGMGRRTNKNAG